MVRGRREGLWLGDRGVAMVRRQGRGHGKGTEEGLW